ncbi:MAG: winged helix-turn-helix transcriptional regulator [Thermoplasmatota archaeon]
MGPTVLRTLKAILVALAIAAVTGTGIGLASAANGSEELPMPDHLAAGAPRAGERGVFNATATGAFALGVPEGQAFTVVEYGRFDGIEILDAYALPTATDLTAWGGLRFMPQGMPRFDSGELEFDPPGWYADGGLDLFRTGTSEFVASGGSFSVSQDFSFQPAPLVPAQEGTFGYNITTWSFSHLPSCLLVNPLQGRSVPSTDAIGWTGCDLAGLVQLDEDWVFSARPGLRLAGFDTVRVEASQNRTTVAWFLNEGIPVPLRTVVMTEQGEVTLDLVRFQAGDGAVRTPIAAGPVPSMEHTDRKPWGLDDAGSRLAFPPSEAYNKAMEDLRFTGLRDFAAKHPEAYAFLVLCSGFKNSDGTGSSHYCQFVLTDGGSSYEFVAQKSVRQPTLPGLPPVVVTYDFTETPALTEVYPGPETLAPRVPSLRALEERYQTFSGDGQVNHLIAVMGGVDEPAWVHIGNQTVEMTVAPLPDPSNPAIKYVEFEIGASSATFGEGGRALSFSTHHFRDESSVDVVPSSPPPPVTEESVKEEPMAATLLFVWLHPTAPQTAGVGLLALLGGLLYWLWPTLKGTAFFGLFSRIAGQDLLEHPARARLLQIVQAEPGIHFQDLVRRSGLPNGTAVHHLGKLTAARLLSARPLGRYTCYFSGTSPDRVALVAAPLLRSEGARKVYEAIQGRPGLSGLELAGLVALQPSTVNYHVQRLVDSGLVRAERDGRSVRLSPAA